MRALLYKNGLEPRSHAGVHHLFTVHLVKTGVFPPETSRFLALLQKFREEAAYADAYVQDEAATRKDLDQARRFVASIDTRVGR